MESITAVQTNNAKAETKPKGSKPEAKVEVENPKPLELCHCGCGQPVAVGHFAPGHDVKPEPKPKAERKPKASDPKPCLCGCGLMTGGGHFVTGHDAKLNSRVRRGEPMPEAAAKVMVQNASGLWVLRKGKAKS